MLSNIIFYIIFLILFFTFRGIDKVEAGVLVPPKGFEYKFDPEAPNPVDPTEEGSEELKKKPKKIYYYPPTPFKNYYQNRANQTPNRYNFDNTQKDIVNTNNEQTGYSLNRSSQDISYNQLYFLAIISAFSIIFLILGIFYINYLKQKELESKIPVYMKYPETKTKLKKRRTVFDIKK